MTEIKINEVYTTKQTEELLQISNSTLKRLLKKGLLRANKIGGQYRILGHELLRLLSPEVDKATTKMYQKVKQKTKAKVNNW
jgi:excisionase family DNA binding protein